MAITYVAGTGCSLGETQADSRGETQADSRGEAHAKAASGGPPRQIRAIIERDDSPTGFEYQADLGFNMIDSGPWEDDLSPLERRQLKAFIWLGGYSNQRCRFNESDAWVKTRVREISRSSTVGAYFIDDEPDSARCPQAPAQMRRRSRLVKSIDPEPPTFLVAFKRQEVRRFARTVDVIGLVAYPCSWKRGCDFLKIDRMARVAERAKVRYWGVIQAHGDDWYKLPTPAELHRIFVHWRRTAMEGYMVFSWRWPDDDPALWVGNHPELQQQLAIENRGPARGIRAAAR
jgi:hypothetical protein